MKYTITEPDEIRTGDKFTRGLRYHTVVETDVIAEMRVPRGDGYETALSAGVEARRQGDRDTTLVSYEVLADRYELTVEREGSELTDAQKAYVRAHGGTSVPGHEQAVAETA